MNYYGGGLWTPSQLAYEWADWIYISSQPVLLIGALLYGLLAARIKWLRCRETQGVILVLFGFSAGFLPTYCVFASVLIAVGARQMMSPDPLPIVKDWFQTAKQRPR